MKPILQALLDASESFADDPPERDEDDGGCRPNLHPQDPAYDTFHDYHAVKEDRDITLYRCRKCGKEYVE